MLVVPLFNLGQYRKGRIINDNLPFVVFVLIVSARIKGTEKLFRVQFVFFRHPLRYDIIDVLRSIAVIRGLFRFKLIEELVVLIVPLLP